MSSADSNSGHASQEDSRETLLEKRPKSSSTIPQDLRLKRKEGTPPTSSSQGTRWSSLGKRRSQKKPKDIEKRPGRRSKKDQPAQANRMGKCRRGPLFEVSEPARSNKSPKNRSVLSSKKQLLSFWWKTLNEMRKEQKWGRDFQKIQKTLWAFSANGLRKVKKE